MYLSLSDKLYYGYGVNYWPLLKVQIAFRLLLIDGNKISEKEKTYEYQFKKEKIKFSNVVSLAKLWIKFKLYKTRQFKRFKSNVLLFGFKEHYYHYSGVSENLYLSPLKKELDNKGIEYCEWLISNDSANEPDTPLNRYYKCIYSYYTELYRIKNVLFGAATGFQNNLHLIKAYFETHRIPCRGYLLSIVDLVQSNQEAKYQAYKRVLQVLQPKIIWTYCYYDNSVMSLIRAANYLNINTVEYQHSNQSNEHFAYAKWQRIDDFSEFFPKTFWLWSQKEVDRVSDNFSGSKYKPLVFAGGNVSTLQNREDFQSSDAMPSNGILVTLQGNWIPDFVENFIAKDEQYTWYFRLHPRYPEDEVQLADLKKKYPEKIEMELANSLSMVELLKKVKINITDFSGAALEAQEFGIKNIIIGEKGYKVYKAEIESNLFSYANSENKFSDILFNHSIDANNFKDALTAGRETLRKAISQLFEDESLQKSY
jgi:hypothetical protein